MKNLVIGLLTICLLILVNIATSAQTLNKQETLDYLSNMRNQEWLKYATAVDKFEYKIQYQTLIEERNMKDGNVYSNRYNFKNASIRFEQEHLDDGTFILMGTRVRYNIIISSSDGAVTLTDFANKSDAERFVKALEHLASLTKDDIDPFGSK